MNFTVSTTRGDVLVSTAVLPAAQFSPRVGEVRLSWVPIQACRLDRCVAEVWRDGRRVETCLVRCVGSLVYRDRRTGLVVWDSPEVRAEVCGQLVPAPRSSRAGVSP